MAELLPSAVYILCFATSLICVVLLVRAYRRARTALLLWVALCFVGLAANNFLLLLDLFVVQSVSLLPLRHITHLGAIATLLYGFIWKADRS